MNHVSLRVLTWNIYMGGDVSRIINAAPRDLPSRTQALWNEVRQTDFPARAALMARLIEEQSPDVIGLQEAFRWSTLEIHPGQPPLETVQQDFVALLLDALSARGISYFTAARSWGTNLVLPTELGPMVRMEDSVAILVRTGGPAEFHGSRTGRFSAGLRIKVDAEPYTIPRAWATADLRTPHGLVRVINAHVEYFDEKVQPAQLNEMLEGPAALQSLLIFMGDFNSGPDTPAARLLAHAGFGDVWPADPANPGYTSAQDSDLRNPDPVFTERLDRIHYRGALTPSAVTLVGADPAHKTPSGLWPSDHAGLAATFDISFNETDALVTREARPPQPTEPLDVIRTLYERFARFDVASVMELIDPDGHFHFPGDPAILPWAGDYRGAGMTRFLIACGTTLDYKFYNAHTFYPSGEYVTALSREGCTVKKTGKYFEHDLIVIARVVKGKVVSFIEFSDTGKMERAFAT